MSDTRIARWTGIAYLALALIGMVGFLVIRPLIADAPQLASAGVALELGVVVSQALAAVGFFALFRRDRPVAAYAVATYGMANAVTILASAALLTTAIAVAGDPGLAPGGDTSATIGLLRAIADAFWSVGAIFFGLWLIPMGWFAISTGRMPRLLGWTLIAGGIGYTLSAVVAVAAPAAGLVAEVLSFPATVGEFWMIGYLLVRGIRSTPSHAGRAGIPEQHSV